MSKLNQSNPTKVAEHEVAAITIEGILQKEETMTFEEMRAVVDALIDEGEALAKEAEKVLARVPIDDIIIGELHSLFMAASDAFIMARDNAKGYDEIIAAAAKVRDTTAAWARYVLATAATPERSIPGRTDAILWRLQQKGLIVDSGERRWNEDKRRDDIVWVTVPGLPADCDTDSAEENAVLEFIRAASPA
jgi:hypothetical protein